MVKNHLETPKLKRLSFAYLGGLAACFISLSIVNRPNAKHINLLYSALLGLSSTAADIGHQRVGPIHVALAAALLSLLFILAEALRSRDSWLRWTGYGLWALLAVASFWWFTPPYI
jgi:hypothetical protein